MFIYELKGKKGIKMSVSIQQSVVEQFTFNEKNVRSVHVRGVGECLVVCDVFRAVGYKDDDNGRRAAQRLVPERYRIRFDDVKADLREQVRSDLLHDDTVLLKEPAVYCFLLKCKMEITEPFMEWIIETCYLEKCANLPKRLKNSSKSSQRLETMQDSSSMTTLHSKLREMYIMRRSTTLLQTGTCLGLETLTLCLLQ